MRARFTNGKPLKMRKLVAPLWLVLAALVLHACGTSEEVPSEYCTSNGYCKTGQFASMAHTCVIATCNYSTHKCNFVKANLATCQCLLPRPGAPRGARCPSGTGYRTCITPSQTSNQTYWSC
jgi:hypothetical protein